MMESPPMIPTQSSQSTSPPQPPLDSIPVSSISRLCIKLDERFKKDDSSCLRPNLEALQRELSRVRDLKSTSEDNLRSCHNAHETILRSRIKMIKENLLRKKSRKVTWRDNLTDPVPEVDPDGPKAWLATHLTRIDIVGDMIATARLIGSKESSSREAWKSLVESDEGACYAICYDTFKSYGKSDNRFTLAEQFRPRDQRASVATLTRKEIEDGKTPQHQWGSWDFDSSRSEPMMGFKPPTGMEIRWAMDYNNFTLVHAKNI